MSEENEVIHHPEVGSSGTISPPAPMPATDQAEPEPAAVEEEHPVTAAVKEHLSEKIVAALDSVPQAIEHDFSAILAWVKEHI